MVYAAIDSGSNTFRLLIAEAADSSATKPWNIIHYGHCITRLGEGLHHTGRLSDAGMQRAVDAYRTFAAALRNFDVPPENTLACATAAVREASNGADFITRVEQETGIRIQIIDGNTEANWSLKGACAVLDQQIGSDMLLFDIGGGSTEFIRAQNSIQLDAISRKLGVVKLFEAHLHSDPPSASDYQSVLTATDKHLAIVEQSWPDHRAPKYMVGTAGTVTTLAATALGLSEYDSEKINNYLMSKPAFFSLRDKLLAMTHEQRAAIPSIEAGRADLIIAGLAIIEAMMQRWGYEELIAVDASLLEGIWLKARYS
ncbi:exopolyphosphatase / guanosine-5'-triphosphate,3'-diphosphate pyrophosphatase [Mariprofundus micogutta]|uniref:Exopolyphosphatase / guanosine-5'-triphosphate,3'-diphosphate pyrophosphatase n=1 Tax=Mariprofundus micogutta TaxID=1921010 RepID=A0A1L8CLI4_9PROT|nr:Ppx/GppA phosphatase family protein [Mariprofundus micogutta]GAV19790.1 exopolyphosphatase / guanosine-5'-triphosphate,3'-diphosphate pyrophosphatase [Mariprofundus micogutta]